MDLTNGQVKRVNVEPDTCRGGTVGGDIDWIQFCVDRTAWFDDCEGADV